MTPEEIAAGYERWLKYNRDQYKVALENNDSGADIYIAYDTLLDEHRDCSAQGIWPWMQDHVVEGI